MGVWDFERRGGGSIFHRSLQTFEIWTLWKGSVHKLKNASQKTGGRKMSLVSKGTLRKRPDFSRTRCYQVQVKRSIKKLPLKTTLKIPPHNWRPNPSNKFPLYDYLFSDYNVFWLGMRDETETEKFPRRITKVTRNKNRFSRFERKRFRLQFDTLIPLNVLKTVDWVRTIIVRFCWGFLGFSKDFGGAQGFVGKWRSFKGKLVVFSESIEFLDFPSQL